MADACCHAVSGHQGSSCAPLCRGGRRYAAKMKGRPEAVPGRSISQLLGWWCARPGAAIDKPLTTRRGWWRGPAYSRYSKRARSARRMTGGTAVSSRGEVSPLAMSEGWEGRGGPPTPLKMPNALRIRGGAQKKGCGGRLSARLHDPFWSLFWWQRGKEESWGAAPVLRADGKPSVSATSCI